MPSAFEVFQGDFEFFKIIDFSKKHQKIEFFNISKFSFQKEQNCYF